MWMIAPATHVEALDWSVPSFVVVTLPVLFTTPLPLGQTPPVAAVVPDVMWTVKVLPASVVPAATVFGPQVSVPAAMAHVPPQPEPWLAIVQLRPAFVGSTSLRLTPFASPEP